MEPGNDDWEGRWQRPEKGIWRLVCGLPDGAARKKPLLMLRLYIDDSGKPDHSPVQILAGYLSTAERWAVFSNEWQEILDDFGLDAFHMSDAWRMGWKYRSVGGIRRDHIIVKLVECIKRNVEMAFVSSVPFEGFHKYVNLKQDHSHYLGRPYFMGFYALLSQVYLYAFNKRADRRLEVIFDEQGGEPQDKIISAMSEFRKVASQGFADLVIPTPTFQSDKDALPLQAADMLAWLVNRDASNLAKGVDRTQCLENLILGEALSMPSSIKVWDNGLLESASAHLLNYLDQVTDVRISDEKSL